MNRVEKYGDGFFETMLFFEGQIPLWDYHYNRIIESIKFMNGSLISTLESSMLHLYLCSKCNAEPLTCAKIRMQFYRDSEGDYLPHENLFNFKLEITPFEISNFCNITEKQQLIVYNENWKATSPLSNYKSSNSLLYTLSLFYSKENGYNQSILLNQYGRVVESSYCNIFLSNYHEIITPPLSEGCVSGVFRSQFIDLISKNKQFNLIEKPIAINDVLEAEEVFMTSALRGIVLCHKVNDVSKKTNISIEISNYVKYQLFH